MRKSVALALCLFLWGCGKSAKVSAPTIDEPDRILYQSAMREMDRHNYTVAQLHLQTLISTYPDSDYFPKAKYALAESMYRQGGRENLDSAETAYKDFIIYFRDSDLADDAQLMVAMTHVRRVQSPDRDNTEARLAELELREMINSYPTSDLLEEAKQKLRDVDEVLAAGSFKIANQYFIRKNYRASIDRYKEIEEKWPDFTKMDSNLYELAESYRLATPPNLESSGKYYSEVVRNYPLSTRAKQAKVRLEEMNLPVPDPNPVALPQPNQQKDEKGIFGRALGMFKSHPAVPTETGAASVRDSDDNGRTNSGKGTFSVNPKVENK